MGKSGVRPKYKVKCQNFCDSDMMATVLEFQLEWNRVLRPKLCGMPLEIVKNSNFQSRTNGLEVEGVRTGM